MLRNLLILVAVLGIGIFLGYALLPAPPPAVTGNGTPPPPSVYSPYQPAEPETLAALRQQLQLARASREQLAAELEVLRSRVEELEAGYTDEDLSPTGTSISKPAAETAEGTGTSVQSLIDAGIEPEQAAWIQARLDEIDLQQLYPRDRATREGWLNKPRYHKERRQQLDAVTGLRSEIGDDAYDRMLYSIGRNNRVVVRDTMVNSPAELYGLLPGDRIIAYDGRRIFSGGELNTLVAQGDAGTMTLLQVERDGAYQDLYLPRGPLGIRLATARVRP
jgi:membrane-associated protease RseP (regulator of RpoE activity)